MAPDVLIRAGRGLRRRWRGTGADLPFGDPRPSHGAEMEGYFWRFTDPDRGRVVVALCGVNRHPDGDWATVAVAAHPGRFLVEAVVPDAVASPDRFEVRAGEALDATAEHLSVRLGGASLDVSLADVVGWPRTALHGSGLVSVLPLLGQYWHPHVFDGRVAGSAMFGDDSWSLGGSRVYAEKNWGRGFPQRWWWGQAQAFERRDVCVAFAGGHLAGPAAVGLHSVGIDIGGVVVRLGDRVVRLTPPGAVVRTRVDGTRWWLDARSPRWRVRVEGDGSDAEPHILPVPLVAERRNVMADLEHLAARVHLVVEERGRARFAGSSELAALEVGDLEGRAVAAATGAVAVPAG
jgi:tocopherol cyclase